MIPLSIILKGIYSYREEQSIDFTRLTEANIFGIFGAVGSGKSTILEAISFAIYGETERLNQRDNRTYNMMNLKSDELLIDFVFITGKEDSKYRFVVKGKRNKRDFKSVGAYERSAYKWANNNWQPIDPNSAESIIGLSYQNFKRTVIVPQNRFQEFLQLGDKDRTQMMKELFNLERFELSGKVSVLEQKNNDKRIELGSRLGQIGEIAPDEIEKREKKLTELDKTISRDTKIFQEKQKIELEYKNLKELFGKIAVQEKVVIEFQAKEPQIKTLEIQVKEYEKCVLNFKGVLEKKRELNTNVIKQTNEINSQNQSLLTTQKQLVVQQNEFKIVKKDYESRELLKVQSEELDKIVQIIKLESQSKEIGERIRSGNEFLKTIIGKINNQTVQQNTQKSELAKLKKDSPNLTILSAVKNWFTIKNGLQKTIKDAGRESEDANKEIKSILTNKKNLFNTVTKKLGIKLSKDADFSDVVNSLTTEKSDLKKDVKNFETELQHLTAQDKLEEYATALRKGDPCPLCGSEEHPHILNMTDVKKAIKKTERDKGIYETKIELVNGLILNLNTASKEFQKSESAFAKRNKTLREEELSLKKHHTKFKWKGFSIEDESAVTRSFNEAKRITEQIEVIEATLQKLESDIGKEGQQKEKAKEKLAALEKELSGKTSEISTLKKQLKNLNYDNYKNKRQEDLKEKITEFNNQYRKIEKQYQELDKSIKALTKTEDQLKGNIIASKKTLDSFQSSMKELEINLKQQLKKFGYDSIEKVEEILINEINIETERKKIEQFGQKLHAAKELLKALTNQVKNKTYDELAHQNLVSEILKLNEALDKLKNEKGELGIQIKQIKENLRVRLQLQKELEEVNLRGIDINTLKNLFKASGFVNYISSVYLQNLCRAANERFHKLTRQKLKLEITDTNNFQIKDYMHDGQVRSVKTLSGGQTFQAALSLALALADGIQKLTKSNQNFFFLDEGFGSLDKESLYIVFDTLKTLRKENRIVGVISHVEEMQQEIDTYLKITNEEGRGSILTASWVNNLS